MPDERRRTRVRPTGSGSKEEKQSKSKYQASTYHRRKAILTRIGTNLSLGGSMRPRNGLRKPGYIARWPLHHSSAPGPKIYCEHALWCHPSDRVGHPCRLQRKWAGVDGSILLGWMANGIGINQLYDVADYKDGRFAYVRTGGQLFSPCKCCYCS